MCGREEEGGVDISWEGICGAGLLELQVFLVICKPIMLWMSPVWCTCGFDTKIL